MAKTNVKAVGIDLGTTNSCVSYFEGGKHHIIMIGPKATFPSMVAYPVDPKEAQTGQRFIGEAARARLHSDKFTVLYNVKRLVGLSYSEADKLLREGKLPPVYQGKLVKKGDDALGIKLPNGSIVTPAEVQAAQLSYAISETEKQLGVKITKVVITVPAHFNDEQRQSVKNSAIIAGLDPIRIINEPTAAALAYMVDNKKPGYQLVFDFGGGTFDVTLLENQGDGMMIVVATYGDLFLGGEDLNTTIRDQILLPQIQKQTGVLLSASNSGHLKALAALSQATEEMKIEMSSNLETAREILLPLGAELKSVELKLNITDFNKCIAPFVKRAVDITLKVIELGKEKDSNFQGVSSISDVILVGGSSRLTLVTTELLKIFDKSKINSSVNPDEVVAIGAGVQAGILTGAQEEEIKDLLLIDATSLSIGIETAGGVLTPMIPAGTPLPYRTSKVFTTAADNQSGVSIMVYQGERPMAASNKLLGKFELVGIPAAKAGVPQIEISFDVSTDGILHATAKDLGTQKEANMRIVTKGAMTEEEIRQAKENAEKYKEEDQKRLKLVVARNECELVINSLNESLSQAKGKIDSELESSAKAKIEEARTIIANEDAEAIDAVKKELTDLSGKVYESMKSSHTSNSEPDAAAAAA